MRKISLKSPVDLSGPCGSTSRIGKTYAIVVALISIVLGSNGYAENQLYRVEIDNFWSTATHGEIPDIAHFSWVGGGTHNAQADFWSDGQQASPGIVQMAESGLTHILREEIETQRNNGNADADINENHWFCPAEISTPNCGPNTFEVNVDSDFPLVTWVSMLGPSPDWFVGVDSLPLYRNGQFEDVVVDLYPYDGGTRSRNDTYDLGGPLTSPPDPISLITSESGQIITPQRLGMVSFIRVDPPPAICNGMAITVNLLQGELPTSGDDVILGTPGNDDILGRGGNDTICGMGGNDIINAGGGNDWIDGGSGDDDIIGSGGADIIFGGVGEDFIRGGPGADEIEGEEGDDILLGQSGDDMIDGGDGVDGINGGSGNDTIYTGAGATVSSGLFVSGAGGNDLIFGGPDADSLFGGPGLDTINGAAGDDEINGGNARDTINGGDGADTIRGQESRDTINGDGGNDIIDGGLGNDTINGGPGDDEISGAAGNDLINGDAGSDTLLGGLGDDMLDGGASSGDICDGQSGTDTATASCETAICLP